jgi:hypothetical protein
MPVPRISEWYPTRARVFLLADMGINHRRLGGNHNASATVTSVIVTVALAISGPQGRAQEKEPQVITAMVERTGKAFLTRLGYTMAGEVLCINRQWGDKWWLCQAKAQGYFTPLVFTCTPEQCYFPEQICGRE